MPCDYDELYMISIPQAIEGCRVLCLGAGLKAGLDLVQAQVGTTGTVVVLDVADLTGPALAERFGAQDMADASFDLVLANSGINLLPDKPYLFCELYRLLKPGGELCLTTLFSDRRVPERLGSDLEPQASIFGGALYNEDFRRILRRAGWLDYRTAGRKPFRLAEAEQAGPLGMIAFSQKSIRAFKLASLEDICEDYGQVVTYNGTLPGSPHAFVLDDHHTFYSGRPERVCGNSAALVQETRFGSYFSVSGDRSVHFGVFPC